MNQPPTLEYESVHRIPARITLGIYAVGFAIAFFLLAAFEQLARPDRDPSVWLFCHDYGWILGLIAIGFSISGMFRSKKERMVSFLATVVTLGSFAWWSMPVLFR